MKITFVKEGSCTFDELKPGDCFKYQDAAFPDQVYMKLNYNQKYNFISLKTGKLYSEFSVISKLIKVECELIVTNP